jgi:xanthine dehydrogenase YagR molybdenum-binding subunit
MPDTPPTFVTGIPGVSLKEVQRNVPATEPPAMAINEKLKVVGKPHTRLDARQKVTGAAKYTADVNLPGMLHAKMFCSTITAGRVVSIDTSDAEKIPGVKAIHIMNGEAGAKLPAIRYAGQPIGAVAATTPAIARDAAATIKIEYESVPWVVDVEKARQEGAPAVFAQTVQEAEAGGGGGGTAGRAQRGNVLAGRAPSPAQLQQLEQAFGSADAVVEADFFTQVQTHSALETHGVVADWKPDLLTVYASTQGTNGMRGEIAQTFGLPQSKVRVITEYMGGGFGAKFSLGAWGAMAVELSRKTNAPVKLMCDRKEEQLCTGNRPNSRQKVRIAAKKDGTLTAIQMTGFGTAGTGTGAGTARPYQQMYVCPLKVLQETDVFTNAGPGTSMRAPGSPPGAFALEQALDELAEKLGMDPLDLREKIDDHEARREERKRGAEKFGWKNRRKPGADAGPIKRGMGMAQSVWGRSFNQGSACEVRIGRDGSVEVLSGVQDLGTGIRTVLAQIVAEELGLKVEDITVRIGDTNFPPGAPSGGSVTTNSMTPVARNAAFDVKKKLFEQVALVLGVEPTDLDAADGKIFSKTDPSKSLAFKNAAARLNVEQITATASRRGDYVNNINGMMGGVQFVEVSVDTQTGKITVERVVAMHDCGRPINPLTLQSQINGAVIQGVGYALYEDRILDRQTGFMVNPNLEQYKIPYSREIPQIDSEIVEQYSSRSSTDAAGIGEPALVPTAAAIANAVYNAIGVRIRSLPMTPKVVLAALQKKG